MTLYLDTSALLKRYVDEPDSDTFIGWLESDDVWVTSRVTWVETLRNVTRRLEGSARQTARQAFVADWGHVAVVEVDEVVCQNAAQIAEVTGARGLDAIHLASAIRAGGDSATVLTADIRQAQAARALGLRVLGA